MGRKNRSEDGGVGEDSFLDTTANLVGVLIILVVVLGAKTKIDAEEYGRELAEAEQPAALEQPQQEAKALVQALQSQQLKLREYDLEGEYRKQERDLILAQVALVREKVNESLLETDEAKIELVNQQIAEEKLLAELSQVETEVGAADEVERPKIVLEHLPTPMARTVFTREMHVHMQNGQVTVIPWDRLVELLKAQVPLAARRRASRDSIDETLGPVSGYLMNYRMNAVPGGFELDRFELEITDTAISESLEESLSPAGRLRLELASRDPAETVVTVWVFDDSFEEFRQLKARLFDEGFLSAARPMPHGVRIGASPRGTRSSAQ